MKTKLIICLLALLAVSCKNETQESSMDQSSTIRERTVNTEAPVAPKIDKELSIHGDTRIDPYYWLNQREDQNVIDYLNAENDYTSELLKDTENYQDAIYEEIVGRIAQTDMSVPYKRNGYYYLTRYEEGKEYPIHSRKLGKLTADEEIMLDVNVLAEPYSYYGLGSRTISPDNKLVAFGEDTLSRRIYTLRFKNLETGEYLEDQVPNTTGFAVWAADNKTLFYAQKDETLRAYKIFRHVLGTSAADDVEIYHEADETFSCYVWKTKSDEHLVIGSYSTLSSEMRTLPADQPMGEFQVFHPRERDLEYDISHAGDKWYIRTNLEAKNFRLMSCPEGATSKDDWEEVIAHRDDVLFEGVDLFKDYLVLSERIRGITQLRIMSDGGKDSYIEFPDEAFLARTAANPEYDTEMLRLNYTSLTTPNSTYDYNMKTGDRELLKQQEVVGDFDPAMYRSERVFAKVRDGVEVPISIVYHKDTPTDGSSPCLIYGYGSYGASMDPYFSSVRLSLLDRGFVYAIAHIRGGEEMGRQWYEDGKLLKKKNTFYDFIDCGKYLVENGYSHEDHLYAMGGSAGGLLMGAVINMEPDMWAGAIAAVPFVDVVTTMLDESIPLTTGEYDEWGNPNDKEYYEYIKSYSPYDQIEAKDYPPLMVTTGLHDSQVQYWEPAKWVAKLRDMKTDANPLVLRTNMETGHGGASGRFARYRETAMEYAFLLDLAGVHDYMKK